MRTHKLMCTIGINIKYYTVSEYELILEIFYCRLENVNVWKVSSQAKIIGTIITLGGATIMSLVGGPIIGLPWTKHHSNVPTTKNVVSPNELNPVKGAIFIAAGCFCWACFYNLQVMFSESYCHVIKRLHVRFVKIDSWRKCIRLCTI